MSYDQIKNKNNIVTILHFPPLADIPRRVDDRLLLPERHRVPRHPAERVVPGMMTCCQVYVIVYTQYVL